LEIRKSVIPRCFSLLERISFSSERWLVSSSCSHNWTHSLTSEGSQKLTHTLQRARCNWIFCNYRCALTKLAVTYISFRQSISDTAIAALRDL